MQSRILFLLLLSFNFCLLSSQVPQGFNYQAVATDAGSPITTPITVRFTIQSTEAGGETFWIEDHLGVTPNAQGLFTRVVGTGTRVTGSTAATFADVDWRVTPKWIKTQIDYGGWQTMGATLLQSVPFSMVSQNLSGDIDRLVVTGKSTSLKDALFEVKNNDGQTIFAVYNEGVRVYIDNGLSKSPKGGFAIGSFGTDDKGKTETQRLLYVKSDTIRMYIDDQAKVPKGGFAIGGFGEAKYMTDDYLKVDLDVIKAGKVPYFNLNSKNSFIGELAGNVTVPSGDIGAYNTFIGFQSGYENTTGRKNVFLGYKSGFKNNANYNVFIGNETGAANTSGDLNVFIGHQSGFKNSTGLRNSFLGYSAGNKNTEGYNNVYVGYYSGGDNELGDDNTSIGSGSGFSQTEGNRNVYIGSGAGSDNFTGSGNVFIGYKAGAEAYYVSNQLNIANSLTHSLITGTFGTTDETSYVNINGNLFIKGQPYLSSDRRLKTDLIQLNNVLDKVLSLNAYYFYWNQKTDYSNSMGTDRQIGLIAQEVEKVFPEIVKNNLDNYLAIDYSKFAPIIIQAMKEQTKIIEDQKKELDELRDEINSIKSQLKTLTDKL